MQHILLWKGLEYESIEHCVINTDVHGSSVMSTIIGHAGEKVFHVRYDLHLDAAWVVQQITVRHQVNEESGKISLLRKKDGEWYLNGVYAPRFDNCIDVDIPLTPLTNSLPINRLRLEQGKEATIEVIYLDLLAGEINPLRQLYRRIARDTYHYENVPNDFEADILVDSHGIVTAYPGLFLRVSK